MIDLLIDQRFTLDAYELRIKKVYDYVGSEGGSAYYLIGGRGFGKEEWQASIKAITEKGIEWKREVLGKHVNGFISFEHIRKSLIK